MELVVATWTLRLAVVGLFAVESVSLLAGASLIDATLRAAVVALILTLGGRLVVDWLEPPERRMQRLRARRERRRKKAGNGAERSAKKAPEGAVRRPAG